MTNLEDLAEELLLHIISFLDAPSLALLSLANRRFQRIVQEVLYRSPILSVSSETRYNGCTSAVLLCRTLLLRPDLAKNVHELALPLPGCTMHDGEDYEITYNERSTALNHIRYLCTRMNAPQWIEAINDEYLQYQIHVWTTLLLSIVPNLYRLEFKQCQQDYRDQALSQLFGYEEIEPKVILNQIAGIASIKTLHLPALSLVDWSWCCLPNLKHLKLDCIDSLCENTIHCNVTSGVETLSLSCSTRMLKSEGGDWYYPELYALIRRFDPLKYLNISLSNLQFFSDEDEFPDRSPTHWLDIGVFDQDERKPRPLLCLEERGSFVELFDKLNKIQMLKTHLKSLDIHFAHSGNPIEDDTYEHKSMPDSYDDQPSFRNYINPAVNLHVLWDFQLEKLGLPAQAIDRMHQKSQDRLTFQVWHLPKTLKDLRVYDPDLEFLDWLQYAQKGRGTQTNLRLLTMEFVHDRCEEFRELWEAQKVQLRDGVDFGIELICHCHPGGQRVNH
ncbi:hypothetical protein B0J11DRAFT_540480 [Dendryphion nanum]|uniref:F-box domain-containing protein n=1 Tax=Dendryphion nanum TaxID=256645 RepID=A0A9P9IAJ0_9PLEO|nr:hypothetical protein B0J11DRAFT_540480 [Dendryphion nanum]